MSWSRGALASAIKPLQKELKELAENPVEGFEVSLLDESNFFLWNVVIFGPPQTLYEGGYFKAHLTFPSDYPYSPPSMRFLTPMFHPNVFENGSVCISILHSPGEDVYGEELPSERWNPTQSVRTILLSVISLLNEPNIHSAAHVDASVAYRKWVESKGKEKAYEQIVRELVERTKLDAQRDGVVVPTTLEEYCLASRQQQQLARDRQAAALEAGDDDYSFCVDGDYEDYADEEDGGDIYDEMYEEAQQGEDLGKGGGREGEDEKDEGVEAMSGACSKPSRRERTNARSSREPSGDPLPVPSTSGDKLL